MGRKKGSIELSANFIVMLIISIVVFGFAIYMVTRIFSFADEERLRLDQQTESMIEGALDRGDKVFIPRERRTLYPGDTAVFGMGILNVLGIEGTRFGVLVQFSKAFDKVNNDICTDTACEISMNKGLLSTTGEGADSGLFIDKTILNNEQSKFLIAVKAPNDAKSGTYIYNVYVVYEDICSNLGGSGTYPACSGFSGAVTANNLYDTQIHKLYIVVP